MYKFQACLYTVMLTVHTMWLGRFESNLAWDQCTTSQSFTCDLVFRPVTAATNTVYLY